MAQQHEIPILVDDNCFDPFGLGSPDRFPNPQVTVAAHGVCLRSLLRRLLRNSNLDWAIRDGAILVAVKDVASREANVRLYAVADLLDEQLTPERLVQLASRWNSADVRGAVSCLGVTLVVAQPEQAHVEIERLLSELRRMRRPEPKPNPVPEPSSATKRILASLDSPTRFDQPEMTLGEAAAFLSRKHGINIEVEPELIWRRRMNYSGTIHPARAAEKIAAPTFELPLRAA